MNRIMTGVVFLLLSTLTSATTAGAEPMAAIPKCNVRIIRSH